MKRITWIGVVLLLMLLAGCGTGPATGQRLDAAGAAGQIAFLHMADAPTGDLYVFDPPSGDLTQLTRGDAIDAFSWSPDGGRVAFSYYDGFYRLAVLDVLTGDLQTLDGVGLSNLRGPVWSPQGDMLAFNATGPENTLAVFVMPVAGGEAILLSAGLPGAADPAWSPDGSQVVFAAGGADTAGIYVADVGGGEQRQLVSGSGYFNSPQWSATGQIAYALGTTPDQYDESVVYVVPAEGGDPREVMAGGSPAWSPDGTQLALQSVMVEGRPVICVVEPATAEGQCRGDKGFAPAWSSDGAQLAYASDQFVGRSQICVLDAADPVGAADCLPAETMTGLEPAWRPGAGD